MVGVPISKGCGLCLKRSVKVCTDCNLAFVNANIPDKSVMKDTRAARNAAEAVAHALVMHEK